MSTPYREYKDSVVYTPQTESNCYGDGTVYRGVRSKDSTEQTIDLTVHEYKMLWYAACSEIEKLTAERDAALSALELSDAIVAADGALITGLKSDVEQLKSALREARGMLDLATWRETQGWTESPQIYLETIATINAVFKEE